jgi:hypothetical protein
MNLTKALKHKKKLVKQIDEMFIRFQKYNSQPADQVGTGYNPEEAYTKWVELTNELVGLKTKIQNANAPIADKIFRLGEVKNLISRIRGLDTKSGIVRDRYRAEELITYVAYMDLFTKDNLIKGWEEEIEQLQEEIEAFNAITKI